MIQVFERSIAGRTLSLETGKLAGQANGAAVVKYGGTVVLATVCASTRPEEVRDFVPLTVDYEEKLYAAGKIPGSFIRREGRPSENAILCGRLIDRGLRPLMHKEFNHETQVITTVLSADKENAPDVCAITGASAALMVSEVPFDGPLAAVHVGYIDGEVVINPSLSRMEDSALDLVIASTADAVVMVEAGASEVSEDLMLQAIEYGHQANQEIIQVQKELWQAYGKPKVQSQPAEVPPELVDGMADMIGSRVEEALAQGTKAERRGALSQLREEAVNRFGQEFSQTDVEFVFDKKLRERVREYILTSRQHVDGRQANEIRPMSCEVGVLPCTHGSGLFTRGETQALSIATLGSAREEQLLDGLGLEETKRFMHHYNFPPFSTGEVKRARMPSRREIGHGALVERAVASLLPSESDFPYTIRVVSEILSSNGSSSMASVCGSVLALMDAGVPIRTAVAGVAMGVITDETGNYVILTDIEGMEDACGDMDFKVAGTSNGITALQLDIKVKGMSPHILAGAVSQARQARFEVLGTMAETIASSRPELSPYAPRMHKMTIDPAKIGAVIGPGGRTIRSIIDETKTTVDVNNEGVITIGSPNEEATRKAISMIENLTREVKVGDVYTGKVTRVLNFGAMVEILPGKEGLIHISELADYHVDKVEDEVKVGDEVTVKVIEIDSLGRINLSRKALFEPEDARTGGGGESSGSAPGRRSDQGRGRPRGRRGRR
ncbi:MAG: polyribonucleotide nucleotidyltransferase [Chloroflexota bacterium]